MADTAGDQLIDLLVVGELCVDLIIALDADVRFGQHEQLVSSTQLTMGSSSAITACGAAALGARTSLVAVRGDDEFGRYLGRELEARGVDTALVRIDPDVPTGASTHLSRSDGDRAILTSMGSIGRTRVRDVPDAALRRARRVHIGSYFLQEELWSDAAGLFRAARAAGVGTSLDGNFDPSEEWDRGIRTLLAHTDVFFANEQELQGITGEDDLDAAVAAALADMPAGAVVVCKLGAAGARACRLVDGAVVSVDATTPIVAGDLVDTVGAGDTLAAGFLVGLLEGLPLDGCLALGVACGTASTRGPGGVGGQPDRAAAAQIAARVSVTGI